MQRRRLATPSRRDLPQNVSSTRRSGLRLLELRRDAPGIRLRQLCSGTRLSPGDLAALLHVSARYCARPEIFTRASWKVLTALASPSTPADVRQAIEARILVGERVTVANVHRVIESERQQVCAE
jgi:hypothetical protein